MMVDTYKAVLVRFMSYLNEQEYHKDYKFSQEELGAVKPMDVKRYMCIRAYGAAEPDRDDDRLHARSTSLMFWKKAISHFMPNKLMAWNAISQVGNSEYELKIGRKMFMKNAMHQIRFCLVRWTKCCAEYADAVF